MAVFTLNLQKRIIPSIVISGKFDGSHSCLVAATRAGNIIIHNPHRQLALNIDTSSRTETDRKLQWNGETAELRIGQQILALCSGRLTDDEKDILLIGTSTHILAYQVEENAEHFYKSIPNGVYSITIGKVGWFPNYIVVVGSNASLTIFDSEGQEIFWTIVGDIIRSSIIFDFDGDGENEILFGSDDFGIKVLKKDTILWETKETAPVTFLTKLISSQFAYIVENGTIGIYDGVRRLWRIKSKHKAVSIRSYDIDGDGIPELLTGWSSGKIDARSCASGDVIFKIQMNAGIAGIIEADYRRIGKSDLIVVSTIGEVRGYSSGLPVKTLESSDIIKELLIRKQTLSTKIRQQTTNSEKTVESKLAINIYLNNGAVKIALASGPGLFIYCAVVFAEGVFSGETLVVHPLTHTDELEIELRPLDNSTIDMHMKILVGAKNSHILQVFETVRHLPQFCMYELIPRPDHISGNLNDSGVIFEISERIKRVALWLDQNFLLTEELKIIEDNSKTNFIEAWFRDVRNNEIHCIRANSSGRASIQTENLQFAGEIIQSLATYLGIFELNSQARFINEEQKLARKFLKVKDFKDADIKLQAEVAGISMFLKNILIRIEDSRILNDIDSMKKRFSQLNKLNHDLLRTNEIRLNNFKEFSATLKELNFVIRNASKFRVGRTSMSTVTKCRTAMEEENLSALIQAIRNG
ncbi:Bardet-Biedl syndrome 2 protein homolog [Chelonus insularis]|uniref:Bardet-Biedl syndrome 2 protein homolog n=1 Tax=Chelonus insularis TaxID=460826 RepID=UPI00158909E4|nr:Bardet-Biedl syndrome 2 protein homolog [Chelonus insularis]